VFNDYNEYFRILAFRQSSNYCSSKIARANARAIYSNSQEEP
jgi:hypothetical protein